MNSPSSRPWRSSRKREPAGPVRTSVARQSASSCRPNVSTRQRAFGRISTSAGLSVPAMSSPLRGHDVHQPHEGELHRREVGVDVGVVELDVADDRHVRQVVDELRPLVEEGAVVLVALDHEVRAAAQPVAAPEVHRHAADQERRVEPGLVEQEGEQAGRRRLAVRAGHDQRRAAAAGTPRPASAGQAREALPALEHDLDLRVAPRERVADHHEVGVRGHVGLGVRRADRDAERLELRGHRRVDVLVGARHLVALLAQQPGERGHGGAADGRQVDLHSTGASSAVERSASPPRAVEPGRHAERQRHVRVAPCGRSTGRGPPARRARRAPRAGRPRAVVVVEARGAALHVAEDDPGHALERARGPQLPQHAVDPVGLLVHVLDEQDRRLVRRCAAPTACRPPPPAATGSRRAARPRRSPSASATRSSGPLAYGSPSPVSACHRLGRSYAVSPSASSRATIGPCRLVRPSRSISRCRSGDVAVAEQQLRVLRAAGRGRGAGRRCSVPAPPRAHTIAATAGIGEEPVQLPRGGSRPSPP